MSLFYNVYSIITFLKAVRKIIFGFKLLTSFNFFMSIIGYCSSQISLGSYVHNRKDFVTKQFLMGIKRKKEKKEKRKKRKEKNVLQINLRFLQKVTV